MSNQLPMGLILNFGNHTMLWVNFEDVMLSKICQSQKDKGNMVPLRGGFLNGQNSGLQHQRRKLVPRRQGREWVGKGCYCPMSRELQIWKMKRF